jgi:hypothetical protein
MDQNGADWCEDNLEAIVLWLMESWDKHEMTLADFLPERFRRWIKPLSSRLSERSIASWGARWAVKAAIRRARRHA